VTTLEFWPDYGGVLLHDAGVAVALDTLDLPPELVARARSWVARYDDTRLEPGSRDDAWIAEGQALFSELRTALRATSIELTDWEGYWSTPEPR
jgi:hypothetical protein